jgi:anti-sigma B factor antagonist
MTDFALHAVTTNDDGRGAANHASTLTVTGEIDFSTSPQLRQGLTEILQTPGTDAVVDLSAVEFVDASGIGVLIGAANLAKAMNRRLILRKPSRAVRLLLDLLELDGVLLVET